MNFTYIFFLGVVIAIVSVLPPGLLNMSAAKISVNESRSRGIIFSIGASLVVLLQTFIATIFARYLSKHPEVIEVLRIVALLVFVFVTIYFLFIAKGDKEKKEKKPKLKSKYNSFFYGMFLSVLNVFPVPYQAYVTISLASYGLMDFSTQSIVSYILGVPLGSFIALYIYILFFDKIKDRRITSQKNMNRIIGVITGVVALITLINILKD